MGAGVQGPHLQAGRNARRRRGGTAGEVRQHGKAHAACVTTGRHSAGRCLRPYTLPSEAADTPELRPIQDSRHAASGLTASRHTASQQAHAPGLLTSSIAEHWMGGGTRPSGATPRRCSSSTAWRRKASALSHLMRSISTPVAPAIPGSSRACISGLHLGQGRAGKWEGKEGRGVRSRQGRDSPKACKCNAARGQCW